jgi:asparagine synthase (glutamine-hydrolysing)
MMHVNVTGWAELDGKRLTTSEIVHILHTDPGKVRQFGGEFFLEWDRCCARDHFGIMPGNCPAGTIVCDGGTRRPVEPLPAPLPLEEAIVTAVALRSDEGITALSGGVDSTLVAQLAGRECISVGVARSYDLRQARIAARAIGLPCTFVEIAPEEIEAALPAVVRAIPVKDPVNTGIALTQYFIARFAGAHGYRRIITGQGADELFGGYQRYLQTKTLEEDLARDVAGLPLQAARDQSVATLHNAFLSMPYLDVRVVRAALAIPAGKKVCGGQRKVPLREVAQRHIPERIAWQEKKAMQYGSGVWNVLRSLARHNGF